MYQYDEHDQRLLDQRVAQFRDQMRRHLAGELLGRRVPSAAPAERPLHPAPRADVPHLGALRPPRQPPAAKLAHRARSYDRGYAHFTTRTNVQFNWPKLEDVPRCRRTGQRADARQPDLGQLHPQHHRRPFAGVAADEVADPRPSPRSCASGRPHNPEFAFLPRKFKIAFNSAAEDRVVLPLTTSA